MNQPCGCCAGIESITPQPEVNRPGLSAIAYRVGTHATFLETMLARLSNLYLEVPVDGGDKPERIYPLKGLKTRDPGDPSIALLDCWATVADVLTFYQERIANEGFLRTATERLSILELARLVDYKLRPGVASSVYLAFTVADGFQGELPAGTRAQSIPGPGEMPQFFETSEKLATRDTWNKLKPRLTRPQVITLADDTTTTDNINDASLDPGTDARTRDTLYFRGISTNLKTGDALLIVVGDGPKQQALRFVKTVDVQPEQKRTEVTLQEVPQAAAGTSIDVSAALQPFIDEASAIFAGSDMATEIAEILQNLLDTVPVPADPTATPDQVRRIIPLVQEKHDLAVERTFTRLEPWLARLLETLNTLAEELRPFRTRTILAATAGVLQGRSVPSTPPLSPLENLGGILTPLALPQSVQPASAARLARTVSQTFSPQSDTAPRLLAAFKPAAATTLYKAWANVEIPSSQVEVHAVRTKAMLFASSYAGPATVPANGGTVTFADAPNLTRAWNGLVTDDAGTVPTAVALDASYDQIKPGGWMAIDRPVVDDNKQVTGRQTTLHRVTAVRTQNMDTGTGYAAKVTLLTVDPLWLSDSTTLGADVDSTPVLRGTVVYAQSELLDLAEEPLDTDVEGNTIELDDIYEGFESGRWIIVSGDRTDIPNVSGVTASELVMIAGVTQGSRAPLCATFPAGPMPFSEVRYTTGPNALGDRFVVGVLAVNLATLPDPTVVNQQYCDQVQLAPGVFANAYVPTEQERGSAFTGFEDISADPVTGASLTIGTKIGDIFAWRISSAKAHTILTLANKLAYTYDATTVTIYANVAKATHGQTVPEILGSGDASQAFQKFALHQSPLTYVSAPTAAGADSTLVVRVNDVEWHEQDSLAGLGLVDRGYITQTDDADKTTVIFGNGKQGARLPSGAANIKAAYRYGIGRLGNVKAQQISQLATRPLGAKDVINPLPATGGADRDSRDQARRNTPLAVLALDRLVSVKDYADFARTYAGIGKASAARLPDGSRQLVHLTIAGADDIPIEMNSDLYRNLVQALHQLGDPYQAIQVCVRRVKLLVIGAAVRVMADYQWESVEPKIRAAVLDTFSFDRRELGQSAFLSEAVRVMQNVEGVSYVDVTVFDSVAEDLTPGKLAALAGTLTKPNPLVEAELAWVNTAVDLSTIKDPCGRILPAELVFLTPDIPDTLILTEISR